jgi:putative transposase
LCGFTDLRDFQRAHCEWIEQALGNGCAPRDDRWSESIVVGTLDFVERVKNDLGIKAMHREVLETDGTYALREPAEAYTRNFTGENEALRSENTLPWNESLENPST